jgi:hypothetical protein
MMPEGNEVPDSACLPADRDPGYSLSAGRQGYRIQDARCKMQGAGWELAKGEISPLGSVG